MDLQKQLPQSAVAFSHEQPASPASPAAAWPLGWSWPAERSTASRAWGRTTLWCWRATLGHSGALRCFDAVVRPASRVADIELRQGAVQLVLVEGRSRR